MTYKKCPASNLSQFIGATFIIIAIAILITALSTFTSRENAASADAEKALIEKYAIQCYASEGSYPADLAYLEDNYGLILKKHKYVYYYEAFASNVLPDIRVVLLKDEQSVGE